MEYINSKYICLLVRDTLKLIDRRPMDHGSRTAYIMCKILKEKGGYEEFELADFLFVATLHDIGVYKTGPINEVKNYEFVNPRPHAIYGYLFMKYISPMADKSKMILYHRTPCEDIPRDNFEYRFETEVLKVAEMADVYNTAMGEKFDPGIFRSQEGSLLDKEVLDLLDRVIEKENIFQKIKDETYQQELDEILEYMIFPNNEKKAYMEMLMYCMGLKSEVSLLDAVTSLSVAEELGKELELTDDDMEKLYYGTLLHDIGMLSVPRDIIEAPRALTEKEKEIVRTHVEKEEQILLNRMKPEVVEIAVAHHERLDGSGYPKKLTEEDMRMPQFILQVADIVTGLTCERTYRKPAEKDKIIEELYKEVDEGRISGKVVKAFVGNFDNIMALVFLRSMETMQKYNKLQNAYLQVEGKLDK